MWKSYFVPLTTMVWPALFPPWQRAQRSTVAQRISTSFPLPSSPHWEPRTTVTPLVEDIVSLLLSRNQSQHISALQRIFILVHLEWCHHLDNHMSKFLSSSGMSKPIFFFLFFGCTLDVANSLHFLLSSFARSLAHELLAIKKKKIDREIGWRIGR